MHRRGDTSRAAALRQALAAAIARDGRPGLRVHELNAATWPGWSDLESTRNALRQLIRLARQHGAWRLEIGGLEQLGKDFIDHGEPAAALPFLDRAAVLSDSAGSAYWQAIAHTWRGRAFSKLGRLPEAEHDLLRAAARAREAREPYYIGEAYHNLAHTYEGMGRLADASRAADQWIAVIRDQRESSRGTMAYNDDAAMMAYHDAGMIRWKAGWHAAAQAAFKEMVTIIDERRQSHYWAGEYFERIGDWPRALEYYQRGVAGDGAGDRSSNLAGLTRAYEALGLLDSAEAAARAHLAQVEDWSPWDVPLLPGVLARRGQLAEAAEIAEQWAVRQLKGGNVHGAAIAHLKLAELLDRWDKPLAALGAARIAESLAVALNLTEELIEARRLAGLALVGFGRADSGLAALQGAATLADAHPTAANQLQTQVSLASALSELGRSDEALTGYARAARVVESMTGRFEMDLDRARFRDRHMAPFDGALRVLLRGQSVPGRVSQMVRWSQRRKAMALALATAAGGDSLHPRLPQPLAIADLQQRLQPDEALIDYLVLDSLVAALVVTRGRTALIRLDSSPAAIAGQVDRLQRPLMTTYAGRLDLARAPFDLRIAEVLYQGLLGPLMPLLEGRSHLILVPDGVLHHVPFEALPIPGSDGATKSDGYAAATYIADLFQLSYLPSAQFLETPARRDDGSLVRTSRLLAITYQAPSGQREVEAIVAAWPRGQADVLSGPDATEAAVRANGGGRRLLHFATHAQADDRDPLSSHLRLAGDADQDGYFHLTEISQAHLQTPLVVLSACETLKGRLFNGEGMMGLARAFLAGGAGAVVATRWPVGPRAAEFMSVFYQALAAGRAPSSALQEARASLRGNPATAHPFYWAGFILIRGGQE
ncbi:MAG: CHAT domain-containing protein [Gemmatimonadetes bacterium]|nr:CHAT domain-containing protein [Gemmatimonadota bacterium]